MSFLSLSSAWLFLLLIPLVAFYFLKLKRPRELIPSLVLWRQVINDQRVNSPFQRFKRNLLLLLQIILLALIVLAAMQPLWRRETTRATRLPALIDVSASMAALDKAGGESRLQAAKKRVRELLDGLPSDQELCLIAFARSARRLTGFTNNTRELRDALDALEVEDVPSDLEEALRLAQALGRSAPFDRVLLLSDGNFPARANFELSFRVDYQRLGEAGPNFGITACNARRALGGQWDILVELGASANAESATGTIELLREGGVIASETVAVSKGSAPRLMFKVSSDQPALVQARFIPEQFDSLASDNAAWLNLPAGRPLKVFVAASLTAFRHALAVIEELHIYPDESGAMLPAYDLVVTDQDADLALSARVLCSVGLVPAHLRDLVRVEKQSNAAIDWRRESPLLQHVTFADVLMMDDPHVTANVTETDFANLGYEILAQGAHGPLIVEKQERGAHRVHLLFHPDRSTLPYRVAFPIFVSNLVHAALEESQLAEAAAVQTGILPTVNAGTRGTYVIQDPSGNRHSSVSDERGQLEGIAAPRAGEYVITGGNLAPIHIGASLLSRDETSLGTVAQIEFNDRLKVTAATGPSVKSDRALWWPVACIGFVLLLVEWWFFQRRPKALAR